MPDDQDPKASHHHLHIENLRSYINTTKGDASKKSAARVRDNQRRARERHKAYFQDLQRKVSEYEKQGVQATIEMQQSARYVAVENDRLRLLLRRKGVDDVEVNAFLRDFDEKEVMPGRKKMRKCGGDAKPPEHGQAMVAASSVALQPLSVDFTNYQPDGLAILADVSAQQKCCNGQTQCTDSESDRNLDYPPDQPAATSVQAPSQFSNDNDDDINSSTTMSCLAAAQIVADLQGHGDSERARASLGCCDEGECTVKNTAVFQVMDRG